jgi:hypothetical protein
MQWRRAQLVRLTTAMRDKGHREADTLEVIDSSLGRRQLRFVLAWAELHQDELHQTGAAPAQVRDLYRSTRSDDRTDT